MQQDNGEDFKDMLNTMKAVEFREKKEQNQLQTIFKVWKGTLNDRAKRHYQLILYCKVFKGLMLARIQLDSFAQRLENVYINLLLNTHFQAIKQFKSIIEAETQEKIYRLRNVRKSRGLAQFSDITRELLDKKKSKKSNERDTKIQGAYKTHNQFYKPSQEVEVNTPARPLLYTQNLPPRPLEDSRKSAHSYLSINSQATAKRKFAAVKQLPRMPHLQPIFQQERIQQNTINSKSDQRPIIPEIESQRGLKSHIQQIAQIIPNPPQNSDQKQQICQPLQKPKVTPAKKYNKDNILSLICQIKILQISEINSIIDQYSTSMKCESMINEKGYISQSIATLNSIISL